MAATIDCPGWTCEESAADDVDGEDGTDLCYLTWGSDHDSGCEHIGW